MGRIVLLDQLVADQIAAGEVVERPASVVKELVENSLDAGARRVEVALEDGGLVLIQVVDDGCGMDADDVRLAVQRHATSKIRSLEDLQRVRSFGFRGEALPSIASVARVEILTREAGSPAGTRLSVAGGEVLALGSAGCPPGTTVTVRDLFYNTPARRKYLKSPAAEAAACASAVQNLALASPGVAFTLRQGPRIHFSTPGNARLLDVVASLYGNDLARQMRPVSADAGWCRLEGLAGLPVLHRGNRQGQHFFINGRPVRVPALARAVEETYRSAVPARRYPVVILAVWLDPELVDVNVHPAKETVRLSREHELMGLTIGALRRALAGPAAAATAMAPRGRHSLPEREVQRRDAVRETAAAWQAVQRTWDFWTAGNRAPQQVEEPQREGVLPPLKALARWGQAYILAEGEDSLYVVDQHAAHERVLFDQLVSRFAGRRLPAQELLFPARVDLAPAEGALLVDQALLLAESGVVVEHFGGNSFLVRALPAGIRQEAGAFLHDALELLGRGGAPGAATLREAMLKLVACRSAVRAGEELGEQEMQGLLDQLRETACPSTCPHGRPTWWAIPRAELERRLGR